MNWIKEMFAYLRLIWSSRTIKTLVALAVWLQPHVSELALQYISPEIYQLATGILLALASYYRISPKAQL